MMAKKSFRIGIIIAIGFAAALALVVKLSFHASERIAPGVKVVGVDVGGLKKPEAAEKLRGWAKNRLSATLEFDAAGQKWTGTLADIGVLVDTERMADTAYSIGRRGSLSVKLVESLGVMRGTSDLEARYRYDNGKIRALMDKINKSVAVPAKDARLAFVDGVRTITPEVSGKRVDPVNAIELVKAAVERNDARVILPLIVDKPEVTESDLLQVDTLLARYTTRYAAWRTDRTHNVKLAAQALNGELIRQGEVFSYNETVGPRLKETGFKDALIYVKGKMVPGTGGGICQVSSTIYNVALLANLKIVERSNHSMPVPYVPLGRDATVAYGLLDLKFENTTSAPIYMATKTYGGTLTVEIYGAGQYKRDVKIVTTKPKVIRRSNGNIFTVVSVYRVLQENGVEAAKERISYDRYNPVPPADVEAKPKPGGQRIAGSQGSNG